MLKLVTLILGKDNGVRHVFIKCDSEKQKIQIPSTVSSKHMTAAQWVGSYVGITKSRLHTPHDPRHDTGQAYGSAHD